MTDTVEGVCEKCGGGVSINEEGNVACDGCGVSTASFDSAKPMTSTARPRGLCTCEGAPGTTAAPPDRENLT